MTIWLERLRPNDLQLLLPQVLLTLDRIRDQPTDPERRLAVLRSIKDQVEAIQAALPEPRPRPAPAEAGETQIHSLTLEQRLTRSWCSNLQRLLIDLGHSRYARHARYAVYREWTLRQLLKGFARSVEYAVRTEQPAPGGAWRALHELFLYLDGRDEVEGGEGSGHWRFAPGLEYKRLLLLGVIGEYADTARTLSDIGARLPDWSAASVLRRSEGSAGARNLLRVDVDRDGPPFWHSEGIEMPHRGWLLEAPSGFRDYLERRERRVCEGAERV